MIRQRLKFKDKYAGEVYSYMDEEEFNRLLKISRIDLSEKEKKRVKEDVEQILTYFDNVDSFKPTVKEPAFHPVDIEGIAREDEERGFEDVDGLLSNTKTYRRFVIGPKI